MEELPMNVEEQLITLIKGVADLGSKVEDVRKSVDEMKEISKTVSAHATRIGQIEESLKRGNQKFDKIDASLEKVDARLDKLERAEGDKAKETIATVAKYVLVAVVGAILSCGPMILNALGGK
jgi:septal ring factor EnvC (AmiA/AmiB activator)